LAGHIVVNENRERYVTDKGRRTMKIMPIFGTRPEAVKLAPIITALRQREDVELVVLSTGQHDDLLTPILDLFDIDPDIDLQVMRPGQTPTRVAAEVLLRLEPVLHDQRPDWILVQGDTTTVMAAAIAAHYARVRIGHVEAGLRSYDRRNPFPEEANRVVAGHLADLHFAPTEAARRNLEREGINPSAIHVTGNPVVDALLMVKERLREIKVDGSLAELPVDRPLLLVTAHRRENFGRPIQDICAALKEISRIHNVHIAYPVHPNPNICQPVTELLANEPSITLLPPLDYLSFIWLMERSYLILTDSGGLQEEGACLGKPVFVLREVTERPEAVAAGVARIVGTDPAIIVHNVSSVLRDAKCYAQMARPVDVFGDGKTADRIVNALLQSGVR